MNNLVIIHVGKCSGSSVCNNISLDNTTNDNYIKPTHVFVMVGLV